MSAKRYPEEFKLAAVRRISEGGYAVSEVARRLDVTVDSLYAWVKKYGPDAAAYQTKNAEQAELTQLRKELKRVTEERDLLKKAAAYFAKQSEQDMPSLKTTRTVGRPDDCARC